MMALHCKLFGISNVVGQFRNILLNRSAIPLPLLQHNAGLKQTIEEKLGLPPKPKRPLTPYFRFMTEMRPIVLQRNPQLKTTDLIKAIAKEWETTDEKIQERLRADFKIDMAKYTAAMQKYESLLTGQQREEIKNAKLELKEAKEKKKIKKKKKELGKPKRPNSPFLTFLNEHKNTRNNQDYYEWQREVGKEWAKLSEEKKSPYFENYKEAMEVYRHELQIWEEKMIRLGNIDIVRNEALMEPKVHSLQRIRKPKKTEE